MSLPYQQKSRIFCEKTPMHLFICILWHNNIIYKILFFHIVFIFASILLAAALGSWGWREYSLTDETTPLVLGAVGFAVMFALFGYLPWFLKKSRHLAYVSVLFASSRGWGCSVCLGAPNSPLVKSANLAVGFLLGVIQLVLYAIYRRPKPSNTFHQEQQHHHDSLLSWSIFY